MRSRHHEPEARAILNTYPWMAVEDIAHRVGWPMSIRTLYRLIARIRPEYINQPPRPDAPGPITTGTFTVGTLRASPRR